MSRDTTTSDQLQPPAGEQGIESPAWIPEADCAGCREADRHGCGVDSAHHELCEVCDYYICDGCCECTGPAWMFFLVDSDE
jgi:hypothetical protein